MEHEHNDATMLTLMTRWSAARRIQRACEGERGPLSALLVEAGLHLDSDRTMMAATALDRFEAMARGMQKGMTLELLLRVAAASELEDELLQAATARYMDARRRRIAHESDKNGPLRQLVMAAGTEIEARRPTRAWAFLDLFDGLCPGAA